MKYRNTRVANFRMNSEFHEYKSMENVWDKIGNTIVENNQMLLKYNV